MATSPPWKELEFRNLGRVLGHAILVGAGAGLLAAGFYFALEWSQWFLIEYVGNLALPRSAGEQALLPRVADGEPRWWLIVALPAAGGLAAGLLVRLVPEAGGPGGDRYIEAFHRRDGQIRGRVGFVKALATLVTMATGGSVGREGPTMQIAAGMGSSLARRLRLSARERRILVVAGAAAATGAIFQIPLGGAIFAVEILYRDDFETDALVPSILASVTAYSIFTTLHGQGHLLETAAQYPFDAKALPLYALMAIGLSVVGVVWVKVRHGAQDRVFGRMRRVPRWLLPAVGGLMLGVLALAVPQALGAGYGLAQGAILQADWIPDGHLGWLALLGLAGVEIIATSISLGSGASGGEFGPTLVIGGLVGGAFGLVFHSAMPSLVPAPGAFALVGMGALLGGVAHVPVSSLILVCELAGSYDLLVPLMLAEGVTFVLLRRVYLYRQQVPNRLESPAHRHESHDLLESIAVEEVYRRGERLRSVPPTATLREVMRSLAESDEPALLVESDGRCCGMIALDAMQGVLAEDGVEAVALAADVMVPVARLTPRSDLHDALRAFLETGSHALPVLEGDAVVGLITQDDVTLAYERAADERLAIAAEE